MHLISQIFWFWKNLVRNICGHIEILDILWHKVSLQIWTQFETLVRYLLKLYTGFLWEISVRCLRHFLRRKKQKHSIFVCMPSRRNNWDIKGIFFSMGYFSLHYFICVIITEACDLPHKTAEVWLLPPVASKLQIPHGYREVKPARKDLLRFRF